MEFIIFISLIVLGLFTLLIESNNMFKWLYLPLTFLFMIVVRTSGYDYDIVTYAKEMRATSFDIYYLREFIYWFSLRIIYFIVKSDQLAFIILDFVWIYLLLRVQDSVMLKGQKFKKGLFIILLTTFPFFFGYENIYRQFFATIVILYSYAIVETDYKKSIMLFICGVFIHNIVILLMPIFIIKRFFKFQLKDRVTISISLSILYVSSLSLLAMLKSAKPTVLNMGYVYLLIFCVILVIALIKYKDNILNIFQTIPSLLFSIILLMGLVNLEVDMIAERLGMLFIVFLIFDLYKYSLTVTSLKRRMLRVALLLIFSLPVLFFASSLRFLSRSFL